MNFLVYYEFEDRTTDLKLQVILKFLNFFLFKPDLNEILQENQKFLFRNLPQMFRINPSSLPPLIEDYQKLHLSFSVLLIFMCF